MSHEFYCDNLERLFGGHSQILRVVAAMKMLVVTMTTTTTTTTTMKTMTKTMTMMITTMRVVAVVGAAVVEATCLPGLAFSLVFQKN
jgi:hypothetical protein